MQLAELNIARWKIAPDDPRAADFMNALDKVNAAAERSEGFVWRLVGEDNDATDIDPFGDPALIVNMSVWETPEHLEHYVWNTVHKRIYQRKSEWFEVMGAHHFVMWWVEDGHIPSLAEAKARLAHLNANGITDQAFDWSHLPHVKLWQSQRCA
jgi:Domain of unknown function (DUF3291)